MTSRSRWRSISCCAFTITLAAALAASAGGFARAADVQLGRYLASECMTCHRAATAASTIPDIFGVEEAKLVALLTAYREKRLPNPVMQTVASRLSDEEITSLALFFATTKKP